MLQQNNTACGKYVQLVVMSAFDVSLNGSRDVLRAPIHLWFYVSALKAVFLSSFSGITTSILQESAACAFINRDHRLGPSRRLAAQTRHRTHRTEPLNNLIQLNRRSFGLDRSEDVLKWTLRHQTCRQKKFWVGFARIEISQVGKHCNAESSCTLNDQFRAQEPASDIHHDGAFDGLVRSQA